MSKKVIAIYARKSKVTDKGESLQIQIEKCRQLALYKYSECEIDFLIYEEKEGKTGANLDREQYKEMMSYITSGYQVIDILFVYKLDRLTRSVQDFTEIYEVLNQYGTEFISVKEDFDTTTPLGRAMLTITVVFAQLEREVIAERIQDTMLELAKTGRWLGGNAPLGYCSQKSSYKNLAGIGKTKNYLAVVPEEADLLIKIYQTYLSYGSLSKVEAFFLENQYRTRKDLDFRRYSLKFILTNPVYCQGDMKLYEYLIKEGYMIYSPKEAFDGTKGIMAYNKTYGVRQREQANLQSDSRWNKKEEWIIAVGEHQPLISSNDWIKVQRKILANKDKSFRSSRTTDALLSGLLRCQCGHLMRPKTSGTIAKDGVKSFYYLCEMKERSKGTRCQGKNLPGNWLDQQVVDYIQHMNEEIKPLYQSNQKDDKLYEGTDQGLKIINIKVALDRNRKYMDNLCRAILMSEREETINFFIQQLERYQVEKGKLEETLIELGKVEEDGTIVEALIKKLSKLNHTLWEELTYEQMKYGLKELIEVIRWDNKGVTIYFKGSNSAKQEEEQMSY